MKVGTDSVLLGAWANVTGDSKILDIGSGTGLLAIMLAQKNKRAEIHGVEIEKNSFEESVINTSSCKWNKRLSMIHSSIQKYAQNQPLLYDSIITNPPFFNSGVQPPKSSRASARHTNSLSHTELVEAVSLLLGPKGKFYCILPPVEAGELIEAANKKYIFLNHVVNLTPTNQKPIHRILMEFTRSKHKIVEESMSINTPGSREYSEEYKSLTKEFYLYE